MKTKKYKNQKPIILLPVLLLLTGLAGCIKIDYFPCERPRQADATESRYFEPFNGVDVQLGAKVLITKGADYEVHITAPANFFALIDTRIEGQTLKISSIRCLDCQPNDIRIHIVLPALDHLRMSGSGTLELLDPFEGNQMAIDLYGSGDIYAGISYNTLTTRIYGSGNIKLSGSANRHNALITGSGNLVCFPLDTDLAEVTITGSGNGYLLVRERLEARITGSGSIFFRGNPLVLSEITGSGTIIPFQ